MMEWIAANWLTVVTCLVVLGLIAMALRSIHPRKGRPASCGGCSGCSGCPGCASARESGRDTI